MNPQETYNNGHHMAPDKCNTRQSEIESSNIARNGDIATRLATHARDQTTQHVHSRRQARTRSVARPNAKQANDLDSNFAMAPDEHTTVKTSNAEAGSRGQRTKQQQKPSSAKAPRTRTTEHCNGAQHVPEMRRTQPNAATTKTKSRYGAKLVQQPMTSVNKPRRRALGAGQPGDTYEAHQA